MPTETRTPMKAKAKGSGKKGAKQATKAPPTSKGKLSAEIIEDSDEDYGLAEGGEAEEDEFAKMVGESLAAEGDIGWDDEDDDEDEQEDNEDEGDEFSGATVVVRDEGRVTSGQCPDFALLNRKHSC